MLGHDPFATWILDQRTEPGGLSSDYLCYEAGEHDASICRQSRDAQTRLTRARGNVEMLLIVNDVQTLDDRCADRAADPRSPNPTPRARPTSLAERVDPIASSSSPVLVDALNEHESTPGENA